MENINDIKFDPDEVQICTPFSEVSERIETLLKRKREENSDRNTRLYGSSVFDNNYSGSSRTSITIANKYQQESESYVKKVKVHNTSGPQCNGGIDAASEYSCNLSNNTTLFESKPDVHERISNLEQCLNISNNSHNKIDIYEKLKFIENHVLKLENMLSNINEHYSLSDLLSNNLPTDLINYYDDTQIKLEIKDESISEDISLSVPHILPEQSIKLEIKDEPISEDINLSVSHILPEPESIKLEIKDEPISGDINVSVPHIPPEPESKYSVDDIINLISSIESNDE